MKKKRNLSEIPKLSGGSLDIRAEQVEKLKSLFPQTVKDGEIDFGALKLALGGETDTNGQSYGLSWAGKADCFRHIQEATTATLNPDRKESVDFDNTENIFIITIGNKAPFLNASVFLLIYSLVSSPLLLHMSP